jgi:hypothetical protein
MKILSILFLSVIFLILTGCGQAKVNVSGKVTLTNGETITNGSVLFSSENYAVSGDIQPNGTYRVGERKSGDGIRTGHYKVEVVNATRPDPKSPDPTRPNQIPLTDANFFQEIDVTTSMTLDLQVPPNPLQK